MKTLLIRLMLPAALSTLHIFSVLYLKRLKELQWKKQYFGMIYRIRL